MVLAAALLWLGWSVWALTGSTLEQRWLAPIELTPELGAWRLVVGFGELTEQGFQITRPSRMGDVVLAVELPDRLEASRFSRVEVRAVEALPRPLSLGWSTSPRFQRAGAEVFQRIDQTAALAVLDANRHWHNEIYFLSLEHTGLPYGPWTVQSLTLYPKLPGFSQLQRLLWASLFPSDPWAQRNPHYVWPLDSPLPVSPVAAVTIWAVLSIALMLLMGLGRLVPRSIWLLMPVLIGWLLLDLRWQIELTRKAQQTYSVFAGVAAAERPAHDLDGALFEFLHSLQTHHQRGRFARVFAFSDFEFLRKRARFHLATWAVREAPVSALTPALSAQLRPGDLILLLDTPEVNAEIRDDEVHVLTLDGKTLLHGQLLSHKREWMAIKVR